MSRVEMSEPRVEPAEPEAAATSATPAETMKASAAAKDAEVAAVVSARPLSFNFRAAQAAYNRVTSSTLASADATLQRKIGEALTLCEAALLQVSTQAIFSPNETVDDVNTGDLKYLLLPFYRGELLLRLSDQSKRVDALREALPCMRGFLADLERLEMLAAENRGWQQMGAAASSDPGAVRTAKIARHKASKATAEKMAAIAEKLAKKGGRANGDDDDDDDTDELEREHLLLMLQSCCHTAIDSIRAAEQEVDMLRQIAAMRRPDGSLPPPPSVEEEDPSQGLQMLTLMPGGGMSAPVPMNGIHKLTGPSGSETLTGFRASDPRYATAMRQIHTGEIPGLYTYTVEEGMRMEEAERAMAEAARMQQMSERAEARAQERREKEHGADEEDEDERQKLIKQDDFREMHKRGAGNRKNRS